MVISEGEVLGRCWVVTEPMCETYKHYVLGSRQVLQAVLEMHNIQPDSFAAVCVIVDKV